jgi:hypothetical protein
MAVTLNTERKEIYIDDIGVTMRTLLAVAAQGMEDCGNRKWHIVYKDARIGLVQVKNHSPKTLKGVNNVGPTIRTRKTKFAAAFDRARLEVSQRESEQGLQSNR